MANKHIHKFRRVNIGQVKVIIDPEKNRKVTKRNEVWVMRCVKPGCPHYTRMATKLSCPMLLDQLAECNRCGESFILNKRALRMHEPTCEDCVDRKPNAAVQNADKFFEDLSKSLGEIKK